MLAPETLRCVTARSSHLNKRHHLILLFEAQRQFKNEKVVGICCLELIPTHLVATSSAKELNNIGLCSVTPAKQGGLARRATTSQVIMLCNDHQSSKQIAA
jgi:hypothetical protein